MSRDALQRTFAYCGALLLCAIVVQRYRGAGAPYFRPPDTILDHVWDGKHPQRHELVVVPKLARLIPRGAKVTCFRPQSGNVWNDDASYFTATGLMPHHDLLPPLTANRERSRDELVEYVIAVDGPLNHPGYEEIATVEHGWLYKRR